MPRYWSSAYFDREFNSWAVGRHDTSRAGRAEAFSTYPDKETAERVAREENAEEERRDRARRTVTHNETTQALKDVEEFRRRFPSEPFSYNWFVVRFNTASDQAQGRWKWEIYRAAAEAALAAKKSAASKPTKARRATPRKSP